MNTEQLIAELEQLIATAEAGTLTDEQAERMAQLTADLEQRSAAENDRTTRVENARAAIEAGRATRSTGFQFNGSITETTDYEPHMRSAYFKGLAERSGLNLVDGAMTDLERRAFTHLTTNSDDVVPTVVQNEIISLMDASAPLFADVHRDNFRNIYEIPVHKAIAAGDAAQTDEGAAPEDEQNTFDNVTITGVEIKKTVKMSRKMAVQSLDGFSNWIVNETASRLSVAAEKLIIARIAAQVDAGNNVAVSKTLKLADVAKALGLLKTFNNAVPKGAIVYANNATIWNQIAMVSDEIKRGFFVNEKTEDPTVQGRAFGKLIKQDDQLADGQILIGYPDLFRGNVFDGIDVTPYVEGGTQQRCFDGYLLYDGALVVPQAFSVITISQS